MYRPKIRDSTSTKPTESVVGFLRVPQLEFLSWNQGTASYSNMCDSQRWFQFS